MLGSTGIVLVPGQPAQSPSIDSSSSTSSRMTPPAQNSLILQVHPPKDISLDDIEDEEHRNKVRALLDIFPDAGIAYIGNSLMTCRGNQSDTAALLMGELPNKVVEQISKLMKQFPKATENQAGDALILCQGNLQSAAKHLRDLTSTTTTTHISGVVQSFVYSSKVHTSSVKLKPAPKPMSTPILIDLTNDTEIETVTTRFLKAYPSHSTPPSHVKDEQHSTLASLIKIESVQEKVASLRQLLPEASPIVCEEMLQACGGDVQEALERIFDDPTTQRYLGTRGFRTRDLKSTTNVTSTAEGIEVKKKISRGGQEQKDGAPAKEEGIESKADRLRGFFPKASLVACKNTLQVCDGDMQEAYKLLEIESTAEKYPGGIQTTSASSNVNSKRIPTYVIPSITPAPQKAEAKQPSSSQRSQEVELAEFLANKLPSPVIKHEKEEEADSLLGDVSVNITPMNDAPVENVPVEDNTTEEDVAESKVERLYESLLRKVPFSGCRVALHLSDGDEEEAFDTLVAEYAVFDEDKPGALCGSSHDSGITGLRERREARLAAPKAKSMSRSSKRSSDSPDQRMFKKARVLDGKYDNNYDADADDEDQDQDGKESGEAHLVPAGQWITKMYRESTSVVVLLGPNRVPRDNVPCQVLRDNFQLLKFYIDSATTQNAGPSRIECRVPKVTPEAFDLVVQFKVCGEVTLEPGPSEWKITSILELIQAAITLNTPGVGPLIVRMTRKLREILIHDRLALKGSHIRTAYALEKDGETVQELFVLATVRRFMQHKDDGDIEFEDDEDEDMTAAQQASYSGSGFAFHREIKRISVFEAELSRHVFKCLREREHVVRRPQRGVIQEISVAIFTDPLNESRFEL